MPTQPPEFSVHRGMSLIELLVVIAILGLLAVTVLPNLSNTAETRRSREAARTVSTFIAKAHSRAISNREWAGFTIVASGSSSFAGTDLFPADVPSVYRGDTVPALLTIAGSASTSRFANWTGGAMQSGSAAGVRAGDLIRFGDENRWYELAAIPPPTLSGSVAFRFRGAMASASEDGGHQPHNTPWPPLTTTTGTTALTFEILRQPSPSGSPFSVPEGRVIDLYWSGYGPPAVGSLVTYRRLPTITSGTFPVRTSVVFDGTGRMRQIVTTGTDVRRNTVTGPVFLLIGRADRTLSGTAYVANPPQDSDGANWQYPDSYWIAIDPFTGIAKSAQCKPNVVGSNEQEKLIDSQQWVRQALVSGGN